MEEKLIKMANDIEQNGCENCPCAKGCYVRTNEACIGRITVWLEEKQ